MQIAIEVNGAVHRLEVDPWDTLLDVLRGDLGLTGTKRVCDEGECGACVVLLDGLPVLACILLAASCRDRRIHTIEALAPEGRLHPLQEAFVEADALQCGFCAPARIMALDALLTSGVTVDHGSVERAIAGICCRCGGTRALAEAVLRLVATPPEAAP